MSGLRGSGRSALGASIAVLTVALVTGCGPQPSSESGSNSPSPSTSGESVVNVVASTDVYGDIASVIGGSGVAVTSIIDDPSKDPHEYQADAQNQLAISRAQVVIENGGGYDDFVDTMVKARPVKNRTVLDVATISGYSQNPSNGEFNEHLWYDFPTMIKLTGQIVAALSTVAPAQAHTFATNGETFIDSVGKLEDSEATIKKDHAGAGVAITEPVPVYLLTACGLVDKTPPAFSEAIEEGTDAAPAVVNETLAQFSDKTVSLLAYNEQTSGPQTELVLKSAKDNQIPAVPVTETLPQGKTYLTWMTANLAAVSSALDS